MKVFFRTIHLYLSLIAGLIIFISCLTGTILVFEEEIEQTIHKDRYFAAIGDVRLPIDLLVDKALGSTPKAKLASVKAYSDEARTVEISITVPDKKNKKETDKKANTQPSKEIKPEGKTGEKKGGKPEGRKPTLTVYVNPYTGEVIDVVNRRESFFFTVESIHRWLLAGKDSFGQTIIGISTFFFLFILITGLILWWPKTKNILNQRLKIKWSGGWKRLNHDLHIVTGFYLAIFLIVISLTGLVMAFNWMNKGIFTLTGSKMENPEPPSSIYQANIKPLPVSAIYESVAPIKNASYYAVRMPKDSAAVYTVNVLPENVIETASDTYYIDQYSGKIVGSFIYSAKNKGQKIRSIVKPLHTGSIYGLPTKVISFIVCLLSLAFPVTGVIMWLNRIKGEKKKIKKDKSSVIETV
ncbi:PepSY-associated TM helix domain-containing protein [Solitalea canadensis]|uniref:Putative iron-regulated membrane protein n=1 Tax=Solitalea canadensis (strain ATCC 29591 / DSM 3403 / JCM 21819 / LMG 8368 / NBRC 15130 / NCIMB 12057 / USAM 9D) TaxID=929556 RepID=H8KP11_SOLCM|nr:PepSY-associated TM helix domain-containing protein [Solitalea canadensis]AFD05533.1 putative iron-regulated membrane protein [Solitalea canadensis DSM 3403]